MLSTQVLLTALRNPPVCGTRLSWNWSFSENRLNPELESLLKLICVFVHNCVVLARVEVNFCEI